MINLYYATAKKIGYDKPPEVFLRPLSGQKVGEFRWGWWDADGKLRWRSEHITLDPTKRDHVMPTEWAIAHELTHWRWRKVSKNALNDCSHGADFLAAWLVMLRRYGLNKNQVEEAANLHAKLYKMPAQHVHIAISISAKTSDPDLAIIEAEQLNLRKTSGFLANLF